MRYFEKQRLLAGVSCVTLALLAGLSTAGAQTVTGTGDIPGFPGGPPPASWNGGVFPEIGSTGSATLTIADGGSVTSDGMFVGYTPGATGVVTVTGAGSVLMSTSELYVGFLGSGSLTIERGARVTTGLSAVAVGFAGGSSTLDLLGDAVNGRGILETAEVLVGNATLNLNGGILRATANTTNFLNSSGTTTIGANGGFIDTNGFDVGIATNLGSTGGGGLTKLGAGTLTLSGNNSYTGGTTIAGGTISISDDSNLGDPSGGITLDGGTLRDTGGVVTTRAVTLASGGGVFETSSGVVLELMSSVAGPGGLTKMGSGSLVLDEANTYQGATIIEAGSLVLSGSGSIAASSAVTVNRVLSITAVSAPGATINTLSGSATAGVVAIGTKTLTVVQNADAIYAGRFNGSGTLLKQGAAHLNLTGDSSSLFSGAMTVAAGRLSVNGSIANSAVTVLSGATLGGNGTVGATTVQSGGFIAPGNSIGTLTVNGDLLLAPGSVYAAEIAGNGTADLIKVGGQATVTGALVTVTALDPQTSYQSGQRYTLLTAAGGINGSFAGATTNSAFLDLALDPQTGGIGLAIKVKDTSGGSGSGATGPVPVVFGQVAQTRNQLATAGGLDTLPQAGGTLALYNSLLMLDAGSARSAFDQLSGEIHASAKTMLIEEGGTLRAGAIDRLRSAFGAVGAAPMATLSYGFTADKALTSTGPMPALRSDRFAVWGQGYGSWGRSDGNGNAAKLSRATGGLMLGADAAVADNLRVGVLAGYGRSTFDVNGRLSSGESDSYHLGLYGGGQFGPLGLRAGASYSWHDVSTRRSVAFAGLSDRLSGDQDAGTAQIFGELGYRIDLDRVALEPFAGLAYLDLHTDGFSETGGAAALAARGDDTSLGYTTLGLRAASSFALQGLDLTLRGGLAWRHAFGDVDPSATLAFAGSGVFVVAGVPIARDAALIESGLDLAIGRRTTLGVSYTGQLAADTQDHAFKANLAVRF